MVDLCIVRNLAQYCIYDMSEYMGWTCNKHGIYEGCGDLPDYWKKPHHYPYLIYVGTEIAGFAAVRRAPHEEETMDVGEFFVARTYKGKGIGREIAVQLFRQFPGKWLVRVIAGNTGAVCFWEKVINGFTKGAVVRTAEVYVDPYSGTYQSAFFRFRSNASIGAG